MDYRHTMKSYACPSCGKPTFSYVQKHFLGPARTIKCAVCGARVSVPWLRSLGFGLLAMFVPFLSGIAAVMFAEPTGGAMYLVFLGVAVVASLPLLWLYDRCVHLVAK